MAPIPAAGQPIPPQTDVRSDTVPLAPNVPLAPIADQGMYQQNPVPLAPLAPMPEITTNVASSNAAAPMQETTTLNQTIASSTTSSVPLAPFPDSAKQTGQQSSATTFAIFNISVYTIISIIVASMF